MTVEANSQKSRSPVIADIIGQCLRQVFGLDARLCTFATMLLGGWLAAGKGYRDTSGERAGAAVRGSREWSHEGQP